ncbi:G-protein beta WD-40 repeats containing protein [Reticulomyxa filosa]|uniref:G-protein beta WD-40 repeats containing protein n=1 Tax=Reticulomyxa filosa TaxID=46433 RepID=X6MIX0_RETFI|nr:G-protein beta WD-40 repeats containing protein [Reticulomyxa filosa]|eukprot:ETO13621.1 G-protein beta WD-40 repeats containing protein [Reticulomyxa filosa]
MDTAKPQENATTETAMPFETLTPLPSSLENGQCAVHNNEILICGGYHTNECYSYHTLKNEYRHICSYPSDIKLRGHCVVKCAMGDKSKEVTLLSFGGKYKHTLMMRYVSVWDDEKGKIEMEEKKNHCNEWAPLIDNDDKPVCIGREWDDYEGVRAVIGGSNGHLLFITHCPKDIAVFNLNTFQYAKHDILPTSNDQISFHCFVSKMDSADKKSEMILFHEDVGIAMGYDEVCNTFQFYQLPLYSKNVTWNRYAYVYISGNILFFGGCGHVGAGASQTLHKFSIRENRWTKFEHSLPVPLSGCVGILNGDNTYVHIIGGANDEGNVGFTHMKVNVKEWMHVQAEKQWMVEEEEKEVLKEIKMELGKMKQEIDIKKLKRFKAIEIIVNYWVRSLLIKIGWIDDFNTIISKYLLVYLKYFKPLKELNWHCNKVNSVKFSPDGKKIVSASDDETVRICDIDAEGMIQVLKGHTDSVNDAQFSPDGKMVLSCSNDKTIRLWNVRTLKELRRLDGHSGVVISAEFSPDCQTIASSSWDQTLRIWDVASGKEKRKLRTHSNWMSGVRFSSDGQMVVSAVDEQIIGIWDVNSGKIVAELKGHCDSILHSQFSSDSRYIASFSLEYIIRIWDLTTRSEVKKLKGHYGSLKSLVYSSDGQTVVSCSDDQTIRLWDVQLEMETQQLQGHRRGVTSVDIAPDGNTIVSSSDDLTIRLWKVLFDVLKIKYLNEIFLFCDGRILHHYIYDIYVYMFKKIENLEVNCLSLLNTINCLKNIFIFHLNMHKIHFYSRLKKKLNTENATL